MAVYEHLYGAYEGESHSALSRFLVIPRYALREVFKSKLLVTIFILCFIYPLVATILVYLHHNANALALLQINVRELLPIDASFFLTFVQVQSAFAFILTVLVAPPLISRDLSNNALPLYLCRPLSRAEYVRADAPSACSDQTARARLRSSTLCSAFTRRLPARRASSGRTLRRTQSRCGRPSVTCRRAIRLSPKCRASTSCV
jgi:hypothetical protein